MNIQFTIQVFREGKTFVAHTPELDVSSCGHTEPEALRNLKKAVSLFVEEAARMGTLNQVFEEAGFFRRGDTLQGPEFISTQRISLPLPVLHGREA